MKKLRKSWSRQIWHVFFYDFALLAHLSNLRVHITQAEKETVQAERKKHSSQRLMSCHLSPLLIISIKLNKDSSPKQSLQCVLPMFSSLFAINLFQIETHLFLVPEISGLQMGSTCHPILWSLTHFNAL